MSLTLVLERVGVSSAALSSGWVYVVWVGLILVSAVVRTYVLTGSLPCPPLTQFQQTPSPQENDGYSTRQGMALSRKVSNHLSVKSEWPHQHQRRPSDDCTDILRKISTAPMDQPDMTQLNIPQLHMSLPNAPPPYGGGAVGQGTFLSPFSHLEQTRFALSDSMIHQVGLTGDWQGVLSNSVFVPPHHGSSGSIGGGAVGQGRQILRASSGDIPGEWHVDPPLFSVSCSQQHEHVYCVCVEPV